MILRAPSVWNGLVGLGAIGLYYVLMRLVFGGRGRVRTGSTSQRAAPTHLSPAAMRYVYVRGQETRSLIIGLVADIVDMAMKRILTIREDGDVFHIARVGAGSTTLPPEEAEIAAQLFRDSNSITVAPSIRGSRLSDLPEAVWRQLEQQYRRAMFPLSGLIHTIGMLMTFVVLVAIVYPLWQSLDVDAFLVAMGLLTYCGWMFGMLWLTIYFALEISHQLRAGVPLRDCQWSKLLSVLVFLVVAGAAGYMTRSIDLPHVPWHFVAVFLVVCTAKYWLSRLVSSGSPDAKKLISEIEEFRLDLLKGRAGQEQSDGQASRVPAIFERYLPYALALGVGAEWARHFPIAEQKYNVRWHNGTMLTAGTPSELVAILTGPFTEAITASSMMPSHSHEVGAAG